MHEYNSMNVPPQACKHLNAFMCGCLYPCACVCSNKAHLLPGRRTPARGRVGLGLGARRARHRLGGRGWVRLLGRAALGVPRLVARPQCGCPLCLLRLIRILQVQQRLLQGAPKRKHTLCMQARTRPNHAHTCWRANGACRASAVG